jgi:IS30 family transposase
MTRIRKHRMLTYADRLVILDLLRKDGTVWEIAETLGSSLGNVYRELRKGTDETGCYNPEIAQKKHAAALRSRRAGKKKRRAADA